MVASGNGGSKSKLPLLECSKSRMLGVESTAALRIISQTIDDYSHPWIQRDKMYIALLGVTGISSVSKWLGILLARKLY